MTEKYTQNILQSLTKISPDFVKMSPNFAKMFLNTTEYFPQILQKIPPRMITLVTPLLDCFEYCIENTQWII